MGPLHGPPADADMSGAKQALVADPLLEQLRRISRASNVYTSISDSAELVRAKLHGLAPLKLVDELRKEMKSPLPASRLQQDLREAARIGGQVDVVNLHVGGPATERRQDGIHARS